MIKVSSVRDFKKLLTALEEQIKELAIDLAGVLRIGNKPMPPVERLARADQLLKLARRTLELRSHLDNLEKVVEMVGERRESFVEANKEKLGEKVKPECEEESIVC